MMRLLFSALALLLFSQTWSQGLEIGPISRNFELSGTSGQLKSTINTIDSTFFYTPDTLNLPFFDDFSSDKFQQYTAQYNDPGVSSTLFYQLLNPNTLVPFASAQTFTDQATFRRTFDQTTSTFTDSIFATTAVKVADFAAFPLSYQTLNLYPTYYIYDTIGVVDTPDTVWVQNPSYVQDSARIFFATLNDPNALWLDAHAYRNNRFAVNPRSLGVVTFDGLDASGFPYAIGTTFTNTADYLHSKPLDLSTYTAADSLYFSFLVQPEGLGDIPEATDSLRLEFYAKDLEQWFHVWATAGDTTAPFKVVHIPVKDAKFFKKGFQFRFSNYGALSGSLDHFHIDYVHLRTQANVADTLFKDFAWVYPMNTLLEDYTAVPWDHYKNSPKPFRNDFPVVLHNGSATPENNQFPGQFTIDQAGNQLGQFSLAGSQLSNGDLNYAPNTTYASAHNISTSGSFPTSGGGDEQAFRVSGALNVQFPNLALNDTTSFYQPFSNFYSYDDGSAEAAFGPTGAQSRLAIQFDAYEADSLIGVSFNFVPSVIDVSSKLFLISVWSNENGHPGTLLYEDDVFFPRTPLYGDERGIFVPYYFTDTQKVSVASSFFIGWRQLDAERLNLGLDRNIDQSNKIQYSVDGGFTWLTSPYEGSAMVHPIFSTALDASLGLSNEAVAPATWTVFPNPGQKEVHVDLPIAYQGKQIILCDAMGKIQVSQTDSTFDISMLPNGVYFLRCPQTTLGTLKLIINN
jgi:hypothetical protein